jgi:hypothetical protein
MNMVEHVVFISGRERVYPDFLFHRTTDEEMERGLPFAGELITPFPRDEKIKKEHLKLIEVALTEFYTRTQRHPYDNFFVLMPADPSDDWLREEDLSADKWVSEFRRLAETRWHSFVEIRQDGFHLAPSSKAVQ